METDTKENSLISIERVVDNLLSAIVVLKRDTSIVLVNQLAILFADKSKEECFGMRGGQMFNCIHANDVPKGCGYGPDCKYCVVRQTVEATFRDQANKAFTEAELHFEHIGRRDLALTTTYLETEDVVILAITDITDQKVFEAERIANGQLKAAIETAGAVCHEMNQPMQVITGYVDMLLSSIKNGAACDLDFLEIVKEQVGRMAEITRKLQNIRRFSSKRYTQESNILDLEESSNVA